MRGHRDLELTCGAAALCALVALLIPLQPARLLAAIVLTLILPGYAIAAAAFATARLPRAQLALAGLGCGLAVLALGTLILNYLPGGITGTSWALLLVAIVLVAARAAAVRRPEASGSLRPAPIRLRRLDLLLALAGTAALVVAILVAQSTLAAKNAVGFTALWMLPSQSEEAQVRIGVASDEQHETRYLLRIASSGGHRQSSRSFRLEPGEERTFVVSVADTPPGARHKITAQLYRAGRPAVPYRRTVVWVDG